MPLFRHNRVIVLLLNALLMSLIVGCANKQRQFERGALAEFRKEYSEAIHYYSRVLRDKPDWPYGKERLHTAGVEYWKLMNAEIAGIVNNPDKTAERYATAERIFDRFEGTGVPAPIPADFYEKARKARQEASGLRKLPIPFPPPSP